MNSRMPSAQPLSLKIILIDYLQEQNNTLELHSQSYLGLKTQPINNKPLSKINITLDRHKISTISVASYNSVIDRSKSWLK